MAYFIPLAAGVCLGWTVCCVRPQGKRRQKAQTPWQHTIDSEDDEVRLEEGTRGYHSNRNRTSMNAKTIWKDALGSLLSLRNMLQRRRNVGTYPPRRAPPPFLVASARFTKPFLSHQYELLDNGLTFHFLLVRTMTAPTRTWSRPVHGPWRSSTIWYGGRFRPPAAAPPLPPTTLAGLDPLCHRWQTRTEAGTAS
jgi:hypothetical protein